MSLFAARCAQDLFAYDGTADVVEVKRPADGILRSAGSGTQNLAQTRARKTIFIPQDGEPFTIRLDTNVWAATGRAQASLAGFDFYGSPHFERIIDLDLIAPKIRFPYVEMHRSARMRQLYADRAKALYLQGAQRVRIVAADIDDVQGGITLSKSQNVSVVGALFGPNFGGPTTTEVHPDVLGLVGGSARGLVFSDSTVLRYPRFVIEGAGQTTFRLSNLWLAANVLPLQFLGTADNGGAAGHLERIKIAFTGATRYYREDDGHPASVPGHYWQNDARINVTETDVEILRDLPSTPAPHHAYWSIDPLALARQYAGS